MHRTLHTTLAIAAAATLLTACGKTEDTSSTSSTDTTPPAWLLTSSPEGAVDVAQAKQSAAEGDQIVIRGVVGGRKVPMAEGSASFVMMDPAVPSCADMKEDHCPTPWDYCCETSDSIEANSANVQLVDESGATIKLDLGKNGIEPLDTVVVVGTVAPRPTDAVLVIKATKIHKVSG